MKRYRRQSTLTIVITILILQTGNGQTSKQRSLTAREIAQKSLPSVVLLVTKDSEGKTMSLGSGFFVRNDVIATNYHVIEGASKIQFKIVGQKTTYEVIGIVGEDENRDIALLKVSGVKVQPLSFGEFTKVAVGDVVYAVGNPEGFEGTFSQGIISGIRHSDGQRYIQITAPVSHGSSGGPILNQNGKVIGVAVASAVGGQNLNFAIPVSYVATLIAQIQPGKVAIPKQTVTFHPDEVEFIETADQYYEKGETLLRQSRYNEALEAVKTAIRFKPDYHEAYILQGRIYFLLNLHSEAIDSYKEATRLSPNFAVAHYSLGVCYLLTGKKSLALEEYKILKYLDQKIADKLFNLIYQDETLPQSSSSTNYQLSQNTLTHSSNTSSKPYKGVVPSIPTELSAVCEKGKVVLTWNISQGATFYYVSQSYFRNGPYHLLTNSLTERKYIHEGSTSCGSFYQVKAVNSEGESNPALIKAPYSQK